MSKTYQSVLSLGLLLSIASPGFAQDGGSSEVLLRKPSHGSSVALGALSGVAYFQEEGGDKRVVLTLAPTGGGSAIRFEAVLASSQSAVISVPGHVYGHSDELHVTNRKNVVSVSSADERQRIDLVARDGL